jgi:hypothetical protein
VYNPASFYLTLVIYLSLDLIYTQKKSKNFDVQSCSDKSWTILFFEGNVGSGLNVEQYFHELFPDRKIADLIYFSKLTSDYTFITIVYLQGT